VVVVVVVVKISSLFWDIMLCIPLKINLYCGGTCHLHLEGQRVGKVINHSLTLKMEVTCSSEILDDFQWTIMCYIPKDEKNYGIWKTHLSP
jgi:hypothetical protein